LKILITGNSGYIGSHLTGLLKNKHDITGMDIAPYQIQPDNHIQDNIITCNRLTEHFDCVIHLAALVRIGESENNPINYYTTNIIGTLRLLSNVSTKHFIFASTGSAEYCVSPYAVGKRAAEDCIVEYCGLQNIDYTLFRFYNVIGNTVVEPTNPDGLFYKLKESIHSKEFTIYGNNYNTKDGTAVRDYVHVDEICASIERAIQKPSNSLENLGHGRGHSVLEIVNKFKSINNVDFEVKFGNRRKGDLEYSVLDNPSSYMTNLYKIEDMLKVNHDKPV